MPPRLLMLTLSVIVAFTSWTEAEEPPVTLVDGYFDSLNQQQAAAEETKKKLQIPVSCNFSVFPLTEVAKLLGEKAGVEIRVDRRSLEDIGLSPLEEVEVVADNLRLQTVLQLVCRSVGGGNDLAYMIDGERIVLTSAEHAEMRLRLQFYPCADLIYSEQGEGPDYDSLIDIITRCIDPDSWEQLGGPGVINPQGAGLVVTQTDACHAKIASLLAAIREAKQLPSDEYNPAPMGVDFDNAAQAKLQQKLQKRLQNVEYNLTPLVDVVKHLSEQSDVQITLNAAALDEIGMELDVPVTDRWRSATVATILADVLDGVVLTYIFRDSLVEITTSERSEREQEVKVYPLRDLLAIEPQRAPQSYSCGIPPVAYFPTYFELANEKYDRLINLIIANVEPESWEELGGPGSCYPVWSADALVVAQSPQVHAQLQHLLATIRRDGKAAPEKSLPNSPGTPIVISYDLGREGVTAGLEVFMKTISEEVDPETWKDERFYIRIAGTRLLIKQAPQTHDRIRSWLVTALSGNLPPLPPAATKTSGNAASEPPIFGFGDRF